MTPNIKIRLFESCIFFFILSISSCKKLVEISPPVSSITTEKVFSTDGEATSAASGMYYRMINTNSNFSSSFMTILGGMSADELVSFDQTFTNLYVQFQQNDLVNTNSFVRNGLWGNSYFIIYMANSIIEGLQSYSGVHDSVRNELIGEAKFIRAFCNFYLVNLFGDIPLVTTTNWHKTNLLDRTKVSQVYQAIIADLKDAQNLLASDYSVGLGQRIIPNKWAAMALLARVYLYTNSWEEAETQSTNIINNSSVYSLTKLNDIFLPNSSEAIWQLQQNNSVSPNYNATIEGYSLIPRNATTKPLAYLTNQLLNAFEPDDQRKSSWIDSTLFGGIKYYYPYKYKIGPAQATPSGSYSEYYMILRLAEQYLIRAEARAQLKKTNEAISDLNIIRTRAGLPDLASSLTPEQTLVAVAQERRIELFAEWGHRWLDIKRTGQATAVLSSIKPTYTPDAQLYPIPFTELSSNPNLTQNAGY